MSNNIYLESKPRYEILDGLRGVAAVLVVCFHFFETYFGMAPNQPINHGYLAVDFFFALSGFVIGYAYDDRWQRGFTMREFFRRRLIRLHPMIILGAVIGVVFFLLQGSVHWDGSHVPFGLVMVAMLFTMLMIPIGPQSQFDVRGNGEMFPINGPQWSLFFEYIGNILYAIFIHKLPTKALAVLSAVLGVLLIWFTAGDVAHTGMFGVGWTLDGLNFWGGMLRMMFPYTLGMFLARVFRPVRIRGAFWICSVLMMVLFAVPYIPGLQPICWNGLFESACIVMVFPAMVWMGASGKTTDKMSQRVCRFLGDISYPLYIVHYPSMYLFYWWMIRHEVYSLSQCWPLALIVIIMNIVLAWACLKLYDMPVRRWLKNKL